MLDREPNRLTAAIDRAREKFAALDPDKQEKVDASLDLKPGEHFEYQQTQAHAHAAGTISAAEAQVMYAALGEVCSTTNGGWTDGTDTATKYVVTAAVGELLAKRLRAA